MNKQAPVDSSPVAVVIAIREDLAEFQRTSSKEALRAEWKAACQAALLQAASRRSSDSVPDSWYGIISMSGDCSASLRADSA